MGENYKQEAPTIGRGRGHSERRGERCLREHGLLVLDDCLQSTTTKTSHELNCSVVQDNNCITKQKMA